MGINPVKFLTIRAVSFADAVLFSYLVDMKTIEERANVHCQIVNYTHDKVQCNISYKSYITGAKEQDPISRA